MSRRPGWERPLRPPQALSSQLLPLVCEGLTKGTPMLRSAQALLLLSALALLLVFGGMVGCEPASLRFVRPAAGLLSSPGDLAFEIELPAGADPTTLVVSLDGQPLAPGSVELGPGRATGVLAGVGAGEHELLAEIRAGDLLQSERRFTLVSLVNPEACDILNQVECVLPFPSSHFEEPAATATGVRVAYAPDTLPVVNRVTPPFVRGPADPAPYLQNDGFSPTVQVLMHFARTPDFARSGAPHILAETRSYDESGTHRGSPTLLLDWESGERQIHWLENDAGANDPGRVVSFLRPGRSLRPGHRYIVAIRRLVDAQGVPVPPEPVFAAIRDGAPSDLPAVERRRDELEPVLERLAQLGVPRDDLILAFDFQVQSDASLTREMLSMRDQAFAWLDQQRAAGVSTFRIESFEERNPGCSDPTEPVWRFIEGTFEVPLFLDHDPFLENDRLGYLVRDGSGLPTWSALTDAPFGIAIPCGVFDASGGFHALPPTVIGHGLFGEGPGTAEAVAASGLAPGGIPGATNWSGMSRLDVLPTLPESFIFQVTANPDQIGALADRLRQGQTNALVLARMMHGGDFNRDPAFQGPGGEGAILENGEIYYWGASLGGIMGHMFAALTPDVERLTLDVPAINFSLLLQRATPFLQFELLLDLLSPDRMNQAIGLGLSHELWVRGEPAGYATHITDNPLPGVPFPKRILLHVALHDQQVSNLGSQLAGATLRLPVHEASALQDLAGMEGSSGPQDSAYMVYDTAAFDLSNPAHLPFVPPLTNDQPQRSHCDPHDRLRITPAALDQIAAFFQPRGRIEGFCVDDGVCNASAPEEFPLGIPVPCDPLN